MRKKNAPGRLFDRIDNPSISDTAVVQIEELILSGVLRENDMLPGERELAEQMGISRPKVREALQQLSENGLVNIIAKDGVYIAKLGGDIMSPALIALYNRSPSAIRDNLEYRREKEGFAARLAASRATARDRDELLDILAAMKVADEEHDRERGTELDLELHHSIVFAAHNRTLTHMMAGLYSLNKSSLFYNREEVLDINNVADALFQQHEAIVGAICDAKPLEAENAAHTHIDYVRKLIETEFERRHRESISDKKYVPRSL
ncbi:FadR/GntR family transcriptional regulator [Planktotalea sp.]|uniref:FadR/GntR family transcriptional regulator n=1 Tax=Planktotalea sp. TaxID=2029877 RepID=UPI00329A71AB